MYQSTLIVFGMNVYDATHSVSCGPNIWRTLSDGTISTLRGILDDVQREKKEEKGMYD